MTERVKLEAFLAALLHLGIGKKKIYTEFMKVAEGVGYIVRQGEEEQFIEGVVNNGIVSRKSRKKV